MLRTLRYTGGMPAHEYYRETVFMPPYNYQIDSKIEGRYFRITNTLHVSGRKITTIEI